MANGPVDSPEAAMTRSMWHETDQAGREAMLSEAHYLAVIEEAQRTIKDLFFALDSVYQLGSRFLPKAAREEIGAYLNYSERGRNTVEKFLWEI